MLTHYTYTDNRGLPILWAHHWELKNPGLPRLIVSWSSLWIVFWKTDTRYNFITILQLALLSSGKHLHAKITSSFLDSFSKVQECFQKYSSKVNWAPSSELVSSSIPSWQISTAHAQPFRGAMDLAFCLKVSLDSMLVWASSEGSGETARMRRLAWTFAARICDKYQIRLTRSNYMRNDGFQSYEGRSRITRKWSVT